MESWRIVWRNGFSKVLSAAGLIALRKALAEDDPRLMQGKTTEPPPLQCVQDWPCEGACAVGLAGWLGDGLSTIGEVEEHFAKTCFQVDQLLGEPGDCRWFLNWFDDAPRSEIREQLVPEIDMELAKRQVPTAA